MTLDSGLLSPMQDHAVAYIPGEDVFAVVGGRSACSTLLPLSKWYGFDPQALRVWSYRPADRLFGATVVHDPGYRRLLVFGGYTNAGRASGDLVALDLSAGLASYSPSDVRSPGDHPISRYHHAAAIDPERGWLVVYGGLSDSGQAISEGCTWIYETASNRWTQLAGAWVGQRFGAVMVYDSRHRAVLLLGGSSRGPREATGTVYALVCSDRSCTTQVPTVTQCAPSPTASATQTLATPSATASSIRATATFTRQPATATQEPTTSTFTSAATTTTASTSRVCWLPVACRSCP